MRVRKTASSIASVSDFESKLSPLSEVLGAVVFLFTPSSLSAQLVEFNGGNNGDASVDGTASVGVGDTFTVDVVTVNGGDLTLINPTSQLNANSATLQNGTLRVEGEATPTNPLPTLQIDVVSSGGLFAVLLSLATGACHDLEIAAFQGKCTF